MPCRTAHKSSNKGAAPESEPQAVLNHACRMAIAASKRRCENALTLSRSMGTPSIPFIGRQISRECVGEGNLSLDRELGQELLLIAKVLVQQGRRITKPLCDCPDRDRLPSGANSDRARRMQNLLAARDRSYTASVFSRRRLHLARHPRALSVVSTARSSSV